MILQPSCRVLTQTLVLPCSSWTCEEIPLESTSSCFAGSSTAALPCVDKLRLWFCGRSVIESKSSRFRCLFPRRLVASNLDRYKASYPPLFAASYLVISNLLSWRSGHSEEVSIGILLLVISDPYHVVIRAIVVTVGFVITYLSIYSFTIYYCFYPSHIFVSPYPTVH